MDTLKVGDKVRRKKECYNSTLGYNVWTVVGTYEGAYTRDTYIKLSGVDGGWDMAAFDLVETASDTVNHPPHYAGKVETIDYILQVTADYPGQEAALVANVIKYVSRAPRKGDKAKDLKKAQWYLNKLVEISS